MLTSVPGASDYLIGGVIAYQNHVKTDLLSVDMELIHQHNVVSHQVAEAMAKGARTRFNSDWAIATTGIAGPTGGTDTHPVGLIYVAVASESACSSIELRLGKRRESNMDMASFAGLNLLRKEILVQKADL
jgi:PncC family amidohydrolase